MRNPHRYLQIACTLTTLALTTSACEILQQVAQEAATAPQMPAVTWQDATLVQSPSRAALSAHYCPTLVPSGVAPLCLGFFGKSPSLASLQVAFDLSFAVKNPNRFPIPVTQLLTAATVFPGVSAQRLGAVCVQFCAPDDLACTGAPGPDACQSGPKDIRTLDDFKSASEQFLVAAGIAAALGETPGFKMPSVTQESELLLKARFAFGPEQLLGVLQHLAVQSVSQLASGKAVVFDVPFELDGTVWLDVGSLGRLAFAVGQHSGVWTLPAQALLP